MRIAFSERKVSVCCLVLGLFAASLLALVLAGAVFYVARAPILGAFGRWWVVNQLPVKADAIVVLSGDSVDAVRVRRAVQLYQQGWAPRILLSGALIRPDFSEGVFMVQDAKRFGAPASALQVVESRADSTLEEQDVLLDYAADHHLPCLLIVTSDYHTRRASVVYFPAARKRGLRVRIISAPQYLTIGRRWWEDRQALKNMAFEFIKFLVTLWELRHPRPAGTPAPDD